jgi:hypothetical protein
MPNDTYRADGTLATRYVAPDKSDDQIASAADKARLSSTAGTGLGSKGKSLTGAPKQEANESPTAYGERMRKWREVETQRKAFGGK